MLSHGKEPGWFTFPPGTILKFHASYLGGQNLSRRMIEHTRLILYGLMDIVNRGNRVITHSTLDSDWNFRKRYPESREVV